ncbi:MAG: pyrimidine/purine nucleoside phosphorylase [Spirochaetales bacterium]|nr:pyrimidine/purine nucleoside phosphorylase [Spirochaetales bacterium]
MVDTFENVAIVKKANIYFDGKVTSRTVIFTDGTKKTLGIMLPGEYKFGTKDKEIMEILEGKVEVLLPGKKEWQTFIDGDNFEVSADSEFQLKVMTPLDYCCSYIDE